MYKHFDFGKIDFNNKGRRINRVTVDMELRQNGDRKVFSASGNVWNVSNTYIICGGQCLDSIAPFMTDPKFFEILRLWKLYHLNDMHPECEHQASMGWVEKAREQVAIYTFTMTTDTIRKQNQIKDKVLECAKKGINISLNNKDKLILSLNYSIETYNNCLSYDISEYYKLSNTEVKALGWLRETEHPDGILCRPCPICGYKYGSSWNYFPIPEKDEAIIMDLLNG